MAEAAAKQLASWAIAAMEEPFDKWRGKGRAKQLAGWAVEAAGEAGSKTHAKEAEPQDWHQITTQAAAVVEEY